MLVRLEKELRAARLIGRYDGEPARLAERDVLVLHEAQHVGVEPQRPLLVVDESLLACQATCIASGSLAGRHVAFVPFGEALGLPGVHIAHPLPAGLGRWADPRVVGIIAVTQGLHVRAVLFDPCP